MAADKSVVFKCESDRLQIYGSVVINKAKQVSGKATVLRDDAFEEIELSGISSGKKNQILTLTSSSVEAFTMSIEVNLKRNGKSSYTYGDAIVESLNITCKTLKN